MEDGVTVTVQVPPGTVTPPEPPPVAGRPDGPLAFTGATVWLLLAVAVVLTVIGALIVRTARSQRGATP